MAKLLKIICNTLIILAVAIAVALLLPPIMGVTTTIIDSQGIRSNLPVGSVTYSRKVTADDLKKGDLVLVESKNEAYEYNVVSVDVVAKKMVVKNAIDKSAKEKELKITSGVSRVSFTIPLIGFAVVAMQTVEGMIVIGLIVLFIIILYILSEVWKKKPDEDEAPARKEKPKKEKNASSKPAKDPSDGGKSAGRQANAGAAAAVVAAGAAALAAEPEKGSQEAPKDAGAAAAKGAEEDMELSEEVFRRIVDEAVANNSAEMEIGLDGWQPKEKDVPDVKLEAGEAAAAEVSASENAAAAAAAAGALAAAGIAGAAAASVDEAKPEEAEAKKDEEEAKTEETASEKKADAGEDAEGEERKKKSVPPRRRTLDEMLEYAKKSGGDPEFRKDDVSGLDVVDYSSFL